MACGSIALISASIIIVSASSLHLIRTLVIGFGAPTCIIQDALESPFFFMIFFFSFSASTQLAGSQFPDQRLNPGHGSESTKSFTTGPLGNSLKGLNYICKDPIHIWAEISLGEGAPFNPLHSPHLW